MSRPMRRHRGEREAQGIGAVFVDQRQRVDDVALRLRHLGAGGIAHQRVDVDSWNGISFMKWRPIIIMRATQKKMMSKPVTSADVG